MRDRAGEVPFRRESPDAAPEIATLPQGDEERAWAAERFGAVRGEPWERLSPEVGLEAAAGERKEVAPGLRGESRGAHGREGTGSVRRKVPMADSSSISFPSKK